MSIGIMGGTFNPIHLGHLIVSEYIRQEFSLDRIIFVPTGNPPHKRNAKIVDAIKRFEQVKKATSDNEFFTVTDIETKRDGFSYSITTIKLLQEKYPDDELYFIVGADKAYELETWKDVKELADLVQFIVYDRDGLFEKGINKQIKRLESEYGFKMLKSSGPMIYLSSSLIRKLVNLGKSVRYMVPDVIYDEVQNEKGYE